MRVEVKIPGSLESYCIDERGDKRVATEALWLETFLCAVLRAYLYADDGSGDAVKKIVGVRRFNPVTNTEMEHKFLDAAEKLFFLGTNHPIVRSVYPLLTMRRTPTELRPRNPSPQHREQPPYIRRPQVHPHHWSIHIRNQPLRKAPHKGCGGLVSASSCTDDGRRGSTSGATDV